MILPAKDPAEIITLTFDYASEIGAAAISGTPVFALAIESGTDADYASMPNGSPQVSGSDVLQSVKLGANAVNYAVRMLATLDDGRKLLRAATLPVRTGG